jgi:hypothetical protein
MKSSAFVVQSRVQGESKTASSEARTDLLCATRRRFIKMTSHLIHKGLPVSRMSKLTQDFGQAWPDQAWRACHDAERYAQVQESIELLSRSCWFQYSFFTRPCSSTIGSASEMSGGHLRRDTYSASWRSPPQTRPLRGGDCENPCR